MIFYDKKLSYEIGKDLYRVKSFRGVEILDEWDFDSDSNHEVCELKLCKQNDNKYIVGTTRASNWFGIKVTEGDIKSFLGARDKFYWFDMRKI